ncbi:hypothetical protein KBC61_00765 [Candidatus Babeliales bacterium]|nr:hypothetical protein [Candidatus Babeliales bacterium]
MNEYLYGMHKQENRVVPSKLTETAEDEIIPLETTPKPKSKSLNKLEILAKNVMTGEIVRTNIRSLKTSQKGPLFLRMEPLTSKEIEQLH